MADMTGPIAKGNHAGGKTFTPRISVSQGGMKSLSNSSEEARRTIMGMRVASTDFGGDPAAALKRPPKQ